MRPRRSVAVLAVLGALTLAEPVSAQVATTAPADPPGATAADDPPTSTAPANGDPTADPSATPAGPAAVPADPTAPGADPQAGVVDGSRSAGGPLAANGLGGALCRSDRLAGGLSAAAQANCASAGVSAAPAPVTHYGFDIHIDTGAFGVSGRTFVAALQTLILTPIWTLLLWAVQAVIAILEWSYALDLLDATTVGSLADALHSAQRLFTQPWLPLALAIAAVVLLYQGVVRRALAESAGQAAVMAVMIVVGLGVIADPAGTVGEANALTQAGSLGTVAAVSAQDPARAQASFADGLRGVYATVIEGPWCYLEFGDVTWCRDPARLDDRLVNAARKLGAADRPGLRCGPPACPNGDDRDRAAALLARARSNGDLFLAFPANGDERNSINDEDSLFRALCGADSDDDCTGATTEQARWRTEDGTWPRAGGLALIAVGVAGMLALFGFLALRLLGAAIIAMLCLLLAPLAVLAPALGEGGRAAFRGWGLRLVGALVSKLLYSAFLGVVLLALRILDGMGELGWWTQWLLIAAFWWIVFAHRHHVLEYATLSHARTGGRTMSTTARLIGAHRLAMVGRDAALPARMLAGRTRRNTRDAAVEGRRRLREQRDDTRRGRTDAAHAHARDTRRGQATRMAEGDRWARARAEQRAPHADLETDRLQARRDRIAERIAAARKAGDTRTVARLRVRDQGIAEQIAANRPPTTGAAAPSGPGDQHRRQAWLDHQATLRRGVPPGPRADPAAYRDYSRLAALVGVGEAQYRGLEPGPQRRVRLEVDRELRKRAGATRTLRGDSEREPRRTGTTSAPPRLDRDDPGLRRPRQERVKRQFDSVRDDEWTGWD